MSGNQPKIEIKVPIAHLQKQSIMVGAPMYGGMCAGMFNKSMNDLTAVCANYKIQMKEYLLFNESLITRARNYVCDEFMRSDCTHLMFIDSDIGFSANDVVALLALQISEPDKYDVITGPYPKKCISWEKIKLAVEKGYADEDPNNLERYVGDYVFNPRSGDHMIPLDRPVEVGEAGTGFMMISRKTFEKYQKAFPELWYRPDHVRTAHFDGSREIMAYFDCIIDRGYTFGDVKNLLNNLVSGADAEEIKKQAKAMLDAEQHASKRYLSEDYMFCYNVQKMGGKVWMCPWMKLQHVGSYVFGGSLIDIATIGAAATADAKLLERNKKKVALTK